MITDLQKTRDEVKGLRSISDTRYENIFKMAKADKYFFYNIIKKITFPTDLSTSVYTEQYIPAEMPWTTFAHQVYGDQNLWWLICCVNDIKNPTENPIVGKIYKILKPELVSKILGDITRQIKT